MTNGIATLSPQPSAAAAAAGSPPGQQAGAAGAASGNNNLFAVLFQVALNSVTVPAATTPSTLATLPTPTTAGEPLPPVLPDTDTRDEDDTDTASSALAAALFVPPPIVPVAVAASPVAGAAETDAIQETPGTTQVIPGTTGPSGLDTSIGNEVPQTTPRTVSPRLGAAGLETTTPRTATPQTTTAPVVTPVAADDAATAAVAPAEAAPVVGVPGSAPAAPAAVAADAALGSPFAPSVFEAAARRGQTIQFTNLAAGLVNYSPDLATSTALAAGLDDLPATATGPQPTRGEFPAQPITTPTTPPPSERGDRGPVAPRGPAPIAAAPRSTEPLTPAPPPAQPGPVEPAAPLATVAATTATTAAAVAARGSRIVPAQAPLVTDLTPRAAAAPGDREIVPPVQEVVAPQAPSPTTPVSDAPAGDRPVMAGERVAALVEAASRLAPPPTAPAPFASVLTTSALTASTLTAPAERVAPAVAAPAVAVPGAEPTQTTLAVAAPAAAERVTPTVAELFPPAEEPDRTAPAGLHPGAGAAHAPVEAAAHKAEPAPVGHTPPTPAAQLAEAVTAHARVLDAEGKVEFRIRLDPPDLGPVKVHLVANGDEIRGQVVVADDAVRKMIESQLPELRQRLDAAGVTVHHFDVTADTSGGGGGWQSPAPWLPATADAGTAPRATPARRAGPGVRGVGGLDVMA